MRELIMSRGRNYAGSPGCFLKLSSSSLTTATETKADSLSVLLARARGIPCTFEDPASPRTKVFVAVQEAIPRCQSGRAAQGARRARREVRAIALW